MWRPLTNWRLTEYGNLFLCRVLTICFSKCLKYFITLYVIQRFQHGFILPPTLRLSFMVQMHVMDLRQKKVLAISHTATNIRWLKGIVRGVASLMQDLLHFASLFCIRIIEGEIVSLHIHGHFVVGWIDFLMVPLKPLKVEFICLLCIEVVECLSHVLYVTFSQ